MKPPPRLPCQWHVTPWMFSMYTVTLFLLFGRVRTVCPSGCVCDDETLFVNCVEANLDFVPITLNPLVQKLLLRKNRIRSVEGFGFYHELNFIDLSHNHLLKITPGSFANQEKLIELQLNNNKITTLRNYTFGSVSGYHGGNTSPHHGLISLIYINLRINLLESIEPGVFVNTKSIQELDLGQNSLRELDPGSFFGLDTLRILRLDHNDFHELPQVFGRSSDIETNPLAHLAELFLGMNPLEILEAGAFERLEALVVLDFKGCHLGVIHADAFSGLGQLKKLILSNNYLKSVPWWAFGPVRNLEILKIGQNPVSSLTNSSFRTLTGLKVIEISGAPELVNIAQDTFAFNIDLEVIEISNAKLVTTLPSKLFNGLTSLRSLSLQENSLKSLHEDLASWHSLRSLHLQANRFNCSCELSWLRDLLRTSNFRNPSFLVLCDEPKSLKGRRLSEVTDKELNCNEASSWRWTFLGVMLSLVITFLGVLFFLLHRFHDRIRRFWKFHWPQHGHHGERPPGDSVAWKPSDLNTTTKNSFLSQPSSHYGYIGDEFIVRQSLMPTVVQGFNTNALNVTTLQRHLAQHNYCSSLVPSPNGHPNENFCSYSKTEYETPLCFYLGLGCTQCAAVAPSGIQGNRSRLIPVTEL